MDRLIRLVGLALLALGALSCVPFVRAAVELERTPALIVDTVVTPVGEDLARVSVVYLFAVRGSGRAEQVGWGQGDAFFRQTEDPVIPLARAEALREQLAERQAVQAWYRANDPAGSAFILAVDQERPWRRYVIGGLAAVAGLFLLTWRRP
jgi:hypothetical protein